MALGFGLAMPYAATNAGGLAGGPSLALNFVGTSSLDPLITFSRASSATQFDSTGTLIFAPMNAIRNNTMQGAVAGTPGTLPTNWSPDPSTTGLSRQIVGSGTDNGITYLDYRIFGTSAAANYYAVYFETSTGIAATTGQTWTGSYYIKLVAGSISGLRQDPSIGLNEYTNVGGYVTGGDGGATAPSSVWQRIVFTRTLTGGATVAALMPYALLRVNNGAAIDITLRIGMPQLELGSVARAVIATTGTAYQGPRLDYNPTTLASQGLLIEEQRTNSIRNNTMQGAVAGTPGTAPTNWFVSAATGITRSIVGTGTESGIPYIDIRFNGTATAAGAIQIGFETSNAIAATVGQTFAQSLYWKLAAGSTANITGQRVFNNEYSSVPSYLRSNVLLTSFPTSAGLATQRISFASTMQDAACAFIQPCLAADVANGAAIDITLRIGLPQLEQGAFATSVIPTTTAAATRSADVASITGTNFSSWYNQSSGTVCSEISSYATTSSRLATQLDDAGFNNRIFAFIQSNNGYQTNVVVGGVSVAQMFPAGTYSSPALTKIAQAYAVNDFASCVNAGIVSTDTSGALPTVTQFRLGFDGGSAYLSGYLRRISYYPRRLSNAELQAITS